MTAAAERRSVPPVAAAAAGAGGGLVWLVALGPGPAALGLGALGCVTGVLAVIDARTRRVPNRVCGPAVAALPLALALAWVDDPGGVARAAGVAVAAFAVFLALHLLAPGELGMGDVKVAPLVFAPLGFCSIAAAVAAFVLAFAAVGVAGVLGRATGRLSSRSALPLVPFLAVASAGAVLVGVT